MRRWLLAAVCMLSFFAKADAQITITASDMPVLGDSLRYSNISALTAMAFAADSGEHMEWNYDLAATSQGIDYYKKPVQVNPLFMFTINNASCYGYKIADSIPGISLLMPGITISDLYTFYGKEVTPPCFAAEAFGATIAGFPAGSNYIMPDPLYMFPLHYNRNDSNEFLLKLGAASLGSINMHGYRKTRVDGWGTITTPYFKTPTPCIRVRSEIVEMDSVVLDSTSFGIPRTTVEYKWLVNGEHYPALFVSTISIGGFEIPLTARYRDKYRPDLNTKVRNITQSATDILAYPNPASDGWVRFEIPNTWKDFNIELFDVQGRSVMAYSNKRQLDVSGLPKGNYVARLTTDGAIAYIKITR